MAVLQTRHSVICNGSAEAEPRRARKAPKRRGGRELQWGARRRARRRPSFTNGCSGALDMRTVKVRAISCTSSSAKGCVGRSVSMISNV